MVGQIPFGKSSIIQTIHETYLRSGSDIVTTSSYQASYQGLCDYGLSQEEAEKMISLDS